MTETSKPPSPLLVLVAVVRTVAGLEPNKVPPVPVPNKEAAHKSIAMINHYNNKTSIRIIDHKMYVLLVVAVPKVKLPVAAVLDVAPNVRVFVVAGVPKLRLVNKGADVVGVGNKLGAVVIVVAVLDPRSRPLHCAGVVVGVPNPKLRPMDVVGVARAPNDNVPDVVVGVPNDVLPKPKPVAGLNKNNNLQLNIKSSSSREIIL